MAKKKKISLVDQFKKKSDDSKYQHITQKLKNHFQKFTEDKKSKIRWVWELIQNAKDAPNEFNKVKIKIAIYDDKLTFSHNDDPFKVTDLQSIISQISSKSNPHNIQGMEEQTTGKYGTGFITTYILSKKLKLQGLIEVKQFFQQCSDQSSSSSENDSSSQSKSQKQDEIQQENLTKKSQLKKNKINMKKNEKTQINQIQLGKQQQVEVQYQKFKINLDRNFNDIDDKLNTNKLNKQHLKFYQKLDEKKDRQKKWQRTQDDFDTVFTYNSLEKPAFKTIQLGIQSVKNLFGYSLLFNEKLYSIQVSDKRKNPIITNFKIQRQQKLPINHILFFRYKFIEEYQNKNQKIPIQIQSGNNTQNKQIVKKNNIMMQKQQEESEKQQLLIQQSYKQYRYLAFQQSDQEIVCIPIQLHEQQDHQFFQILQIPADLPKVFKQFPLIGCHNTNFNFVFTSKKFEPNETRSQLLLKQLQGIQQVKVRKNYQELIKVFQSAQKLYTYLLPNTKYGIKNYFQFSLKNYFTQQNPKFQQCLKKYIKKILDLKCIQMRNEEKAKVSGLRFLYDGNIQESQKNISSQMNNIFYFLYGSQCTLSQKSYMELFQIFIEKKQILKEYIKYLNPLDCLNQINNKNFKSFEYNLKSQNSNGLQKMKQIFEYLSKYTEYLNINDSPILDLKIFLTNKKQFKSFNERLFVKKQLSLALQQIANILGINYEDQLLHDELIQYIKNCRQQDYFSSEDMIKLFKKYFCCQIQNNDSQLDFEKFTQLGRFLQSFNTYKTQVLPKIVENFKLLKGMKKFQLKYRLPILQDSDQIAFERKFILKLLSFINSKIEQNQEVDSFCKTFLINTMDFYQWFNNILTLNNQFNENIIKFSISNNNLFKENKALLFIQQNKQYPTVNDQKIYNQIINPHKHLSELLLHKKIKSHVNLLPYQFNVHFKQLINIFNKVGYQETFKQNRRKILKYVNQVNDEHQKCNNQNTLVKYNTLKSIIQNRHKLIINNSQLNDKQKGTIFHLINCKEDLDFVTKLRQLNSLQNIYQRQEQNEKIEKLINKKMIKK